MIFLSVPLRLVHARRPRPARSAIVDAFTTAITKVLTAAGVALVVAACQGVEPPSYAADRVEIIRTAYGVPHLRADDLEALGYGLAWVQMEDYGEEVLRRLLSSRGELARHLGPDHLDSDLAAKPGYMRARDTYDGFPPDTRAVMEGFAAGVNAYVRIHADELPVWARDTFSGVDVAARDVGSWSRARARAVLERMELDDSLVGGVPLDEAEGLDPRDGSNVWALAPSRTASGEAMLMRNPHLLWSAGYYEAHVTIPGQLDFYGDFRVGGAFGIIGGFNRRLGWSTTNNYPTLDQAYRLRLDPDRTDHARLGDAAYPLTSQVVTAEVLQEDSTLATVSRRLWTTELGPVIHRDDSTVIVLKAATLDTPSRGEQFLRMMRATSLDEWKDAMRVRAMPSSNLTYADANGNIFYVWNARLPAFPHEPADTALFADDESDVWTDLVPWDSLPWLANPVGGYVQNANDPPHYTNLRATLDASDLPVGVPEPRLRLRSQLSLQLVEELGSDLRLEDVIRAKHDLTMLAATRLKPDLVLAARMAVADGTLPAGADPDQVEAAAALLAAWDNTAAAAARGAVLFDRWLRRYDDQVDSAAFWATPWNAAAPAATPTGLGDPEVGVEALVWAMGEANSRWGGWNVAWGSVHRARLGDVDLPAAGCSNLAGCFRVLEFREGEDGLLEVSRGDGWIFAVEFTEPLNAYTVLAYGQTNDPESPHHTDQLAMFLDGRMKRVLFDAAQVDSAAVIRYRPER
jgi:acyl-homoserine-lactone acylase